MTDITSKPLERKDFLTNIRVAKKFGISTEEAKKILKKLYLAKKQIYVRHPNGSHKNPAVTTNRRNHTSGEYLLHPAAHELFMQELAKLKEK